MGDDSAETEEAVSAVAARTPIESTHPGNTPDPTRNVMAVIAAAVQRQDDLRHAESRHIREVSNLREHFADEIRKAEAARIDAIREVDVGARVRAEEVNAAQAQTLAQQVALSAEALRAQVETARQQQATALAAALDPIMKDIQDLRRAQYEAQGSKTQVVESSTSSRSTASIVIAAAVGLFGLLLSLTAIVVTLVLSRGSS